MSYLLDALRKSETERLQRANRPWVQTVQAGHMQAPRARWWAIGGFLALMVMNLVLIGHLVWQTPEAESSISPPSHEPAQRVASPSLPDASQPVPQPLAPAVASGSHEQLPAKPAIIVPRAAGNASGIILPASGGRVPHLVELPLSFQKSVPDLTFHSHIVSSNAAANSLVINGQYLRRGDRLGALLVEQIQDEHVVFRQQEQRFRVGTARHWVSPH